MGDKDGPVPILVHLGRLLVFHRVARDDLCPKVGFHLVVEVGQRAVAADVLDLQALFVALEGLEVLRGVAIVLSLELLLAVKSQEPAGVTPTFFRTFGIAGWVYTNDIPEYSLANIGIVSDLYIT